jgi:hypothetical protein
MVRPPPGGRQQPVRHATGHRSCASKPVMRPVRTILTVTVLAALSGCTPSTPPADGDLVLQVRNDGDGGMAIGFRITQVVPKISVYSDGRVITYTRAPFGVRNPALPDLQVRHIGQDEVRALVGRAVEAGVGGGADLGTLKAVDGSMDAATTLISVRNASGALVTAAAPALGTGDESRLTGAQRQARQKLVDLLAALDDLPHTLGAGHVGKPRPYGPELVAAIATDWTPYGDGQPEDPPQAWPGPALPGPVPSEAAGPARRGINCLTTSAGPVLSAARRATVATPWTSGGRQWRVFIRPLLPGERTCADLNHS